MNNNNIHTLFKTLTDILPYEYSEYLLKSTESIAIIKKESTTIVYLTEDETKPGVLNATSYDTEDDELLPYGTARFDTTDPDFNILDAINEIKQLF